MWEPLADLHVHTVASACAELEMLPPLIVKRALEVGLGVIAVTDHNTAENVLAVQRAAEGTGLWVLAGMEAQTREEAHILCLFDTVEQVLAWQEVIYNHLPPFKNEEALWGMQLIVNEEGDYVRTNDRLLQVATSLSVEEVVAGVHTLGGLAIAAHVDRVAFSLLGSLGFIPQGLALDALELTPRTPLERFRAEHAELEGWPIIVSCDAHRLADLHPHMRLRLEEPAVAELMKAFRGEGGRFLELLAP